MYIISYVIVYRFCDDIHVRCRRCEKTKSGRNCTVVTLTFTIVLGCVIIYALHLAKKDDRRSRRCDYSCVVIKNAFCET